MDVSLSNRSSLLLTRFRMRFLSSLLLAALVSHCSNHSNRHRRTPSKTSARRSRWIDTRIRSLYRIRRLRISLAPFLTTVPIPPVARTRARGGLQGWGNDEGFLRHWDQRGAWVCSYFLRGRRRRGMLRWERERDGWRHGGDGGGHAMPYDGTAALPVTPTPEEEVGGSHSYSTCVELED
jgi:hypothetical protein